MRVPAPTPAPERGPVLPPLTADDFEMRWDADHTFPFTEDEDATIMAYGRHDPTEFVRQVFVYDQLTGETDSSDGPMDAGEVQHKWAVHLDRGGEEDGWWITWGDVTESTEQAFPVTVVIR